MQWVLVLVMAAGTAQHTWYSQQATNAEIPASVFHGVEGDCGPEGDGGDAATNRLKNRPDVPATYQPWSWDKLAGLPFPKGAPQSRLKWTAEQLKVIAPNEEKAVSVEGYLAKAKVESSSVNGEKGGESTNCHFRVAQDVDWHLALVKNAGDAESTSVVVETTPRSRIHHGWTVAKLHKLMAQNARFRISGRTMVDPEHQAMIGTHRCTIWELHPVTEIEVLVEGKWIKLDDVK